MSNVIQIKRGMSAPSNGVLQPGELGINMASGVLYIGSDQQDGNKKYMPMYPRAYHLHNGAIIHTTSVGDQEEQSKNPSSYGPWMALHFHSSSDDSRASIMITNKNAFNFNCREKDGQFSDRYLLPEPTIDLIEDKWYNILTSKNVVTVDQGGTGLRTLTAGCALVGSDNNAIDLRAITNNTAIGNCGWISRETNGTNLITLNTLAFWNGRYNNTTSNLAYCSKGAFTDAATKEISSPNLKTEGGYTTGEISSSADELLINGRTIRWWNGAHTKTTNGSTVYYSSNLAYCNKGAFGTFAVKNIDSFLQSYNDTVSKIVLKGATVLNSNTFGDANPKICFYNNSNAKGISLTYSNYDTDSKHPPSLTLNGQQGGEYFIAPFVKARFVTVSYGPYNPSGTGVTGQLYFKVV